jgi:hypothetical protein
LRGDAYKILGCERDTFQATGAAGNGIQDATEKAGLVCLVAILEKNNMSYLNPLTLPELNQRVSELEQKYRATTREFVGDQEVRARVSEDDVLMWETYIAFRRELSAMDERTQREYLEIINHRAQKSESSAATVIEYAA